MFLIKTKKTMKGKLLRLMQMKNHGIKSVLEQKND